MAKKLKPNLAALAQAAGYVNVAPGLIPTRSPLDPLLGGGLVEGTTLLVVAEAGQGKTALLQYIQGRIASISPFKFGRAAYIGCDHSSNHPQYGWANTIKELAQVVEDVKTTAGGDPVFCIDDVTMYAAGPGMAASAAAWTKLLHKWKDMTLVLGVQAKRNMPPKLKTLKPGGGRVLGFQASTILNVNIQATIPNGVVLNIKTTKSRWSRPGTSCLLSIVRDETGLWTEEVL